VQEDDHGGSREVTFVAKLGAPGWYRAALSQPLSFAVAFGLVAVVRKLYGYDPIADQSTIGS